MGSILILLLIIPLFLGTANSLLNRRAGANPHKTPFTAGKYTHIVFVPLYAGLHLWVFGFDLFPLLCGCAYLLIYVNCLLYLNWFLFLATESSLHIQLLLQLHGSNEMTVERIREQYNKKVISQIRVLRLIDLGQLRLENGRIYVAGRSVLYAALVCRIMRNILGIPEHPELAGHPPGAPADETDALTNDK